MKPSAIFLILILLFSSFAKAQSAFEHISNTAVYDYLEEMAINGYISLNPIVKPYSKTFIAQKLTELKQKENELSKPQRSMLNLYLQEYAPEVGILKKGKATIYTDSSGSIHLLPPEVVYRDNQFRITLRPIYGIRYFSSTNESFYHSYGGAEFTAYAGNRWAAWASVRDNYQTLEPLARPSHLTNEAGGNYKIGVQGRSGAEYSEMRGGISYDWKWGNISFAKDHLQWGTGYNGTNIFSGRTPSFPFVKLQLNPLPWLEFTYFHAWLVSEIIDSTRSYITSNGDFRGVYRQKYIAANMYTFKPSEDLNIAIGNSIIYSDVPVQPAYLIPFFFFKSLDHTLNKGIDNQNSAMFVSVSSMQIKHLHLYGTVFIDELSFSRWGDPDRHNFYSYKTGFRLQGWPFRNAGINAEFTRTSPLTYKHRVPATTFENNRFNLGHYLRDNSEELHLALYLNPWNKMRLKASFTNAWHANEYQYVFGGTPVDENPVLQDKTWSSRQYSFDLSYHVVHNLKVFGNFTYANIQGYAIDNLQPIDYLNKFTPKYLHGKTNTLTLGFNLGF